MLKRVLAFSFIFLLFGCSSDFGSKIIGGNLTVYYIEESDIDKAEEVAMFWKKNQLISVEKQDVQLLKVEGVYNLRIISNGDADTKNMSFDERKLLLELQKKIKKAIFPNNTFELVICNNKFEPIYNLN